jgi:spore maturation protein A
MLGRIVGVIAILAVFFAIVCGNLTALAPAVLDGAADAVTLTVSLTGMMCLWCGVLRVLKEAGAIRALTRMTRPLLRLFFPQAAKHPDIAEDVAANLAANLLGVGNAATPLALSAMKKLKSVSKEGDRASPDMITLAVMNTASFSLVPSTVLTLLRSAGATDPFAVVLPIWITSSLTALLALTLSRLIGGAYGRMLEGGRSAKLSAVRDAEVEKYEKRGGVSVEGT